MENFGDRIKKVRLLRKLSQDALGRLCGLSQSAISSYERGTRKAPRELPQLAQALGANIFWLTRGTGPMWAAETQALATVQESPWPFPTIEAQRYWALSIDARRTIETTVATLIDCFDAPQ